MAVVYVGMVLGNVVCPVFSTRTSEDVKVALVDTITKQVIPHIDRFGSSLLDTFVCYPTCTLVVSVDVNQGLRISHVFDSRVKCLGVLGFVEQCPRFRFGC